MKPILFSTEMVQAILKGRKTVTRRKIKLDLSMADMDNNDSSYLYLPTDSQRGYIHAKELCKYQPGDILYVRETFCEIPCEYNLIPIKGGHITVPRVAYRADSKIDYTGIWKPSIHMPKRLARIFLEVTDLKVERVQDITEEQAIKEGAGLVNGNLKPINTSQVERFKEIWHDIYGDWEDNPFVYVIEFEVKE